MSKITPINKEPQQPTFQPLFTDKEVAEYGEVISTTEAGQVFVKKDDKVFLFQPVACTHKCTEEYYYTRVDFK